MQCPYIYIILCIHTISPNQSSQLTFQFTGPKFIFRNFYIVTVGLQQLILQVHRRFLGLGLLLNREDCNDPLFPIIEQLVHYFIERVKIQNLLPDWGSITGICETLMFYVYNFTELHCTCTGTCVLCSTALMSLVYSLVRTYRHLMICEVQCIGR